MFCCRLRSSYVCSRLSCVRAIRMTPRKRLIVPAEDTVLSTLERLLSSRDLATIKGDAILHFMAGKMVYTVHSTHTCRWFVAPSNPFYTYLYHLPGKITNSLLLECFVQPTSHAFYLLTNCFSFLVAILLKKSVLRQ